MRKPVRALGLVLIVALAACTQMPADYRSDQQEKGRIVVVATLFPLYEFAGAVGQDKASVAMLLPPGAEPHSFEPRPSDIRRIMAADVFIYIGQAMEPWAHDIVEGTGTGIVIEAAEHASLIQAGNHDEQDEHEEHHEDEQHTQHDEPGEHHSHHDHGAYDPHIWLDFDNDMMLIDAIAERFSAIMPEHSQYFQANAKAYKERLAALDSDYAQGLKSCRQDTIVSAGHNSLGYLEKRYGFSSLTVYGISPDSEPTPKKVAEIADTLREAGIRHVLFEEMIDPRVAEVLAAETGAGTIMFNPGASVPKGSISNEYSFLSLMESNLESLRAALECQ